MMSLVSTPLSVARVAAPKKAIRKTVTAKASAADAAKSAAVAGALALTIAAQPALALGEVAQIADAKGAELAASLNAELLAKKKVPAPVKKTKNLAAGLPSLPSLPTFSAPSLPSGGGAKAPAAKAAPKAPAEKIEGSGALGLAMVVLFSPLLAVGALSVQTLLRVIPQAAEGKDFFPKDTMDF